MEVGINEKASNLSPEAVWQNCLGTLRELISEKNFNTWITPIQPLSIVGSTITIQVPSQYFYEQLEAFFLEPLGEALRKELGEDADMIYSVLVDKGNQQVKPITINIPSQKGAKPNYGASLNPFHNVQSEFTNHDGNLNTDYTFETLVEADCNRLAVAAGIRISNMPGTNGFNPLMVYGGVGLGKTHLVQAIGNKIRELHPQKRVVYVTTEQFYSQFLDALKSDVIQQFVNFYMSVDALIVDDIQFLTGKSQTQELFFNVFNRLHQKNKQIILTSDCAPRDLKGMHERLTTRFKWGLTADLQLPGFETRLAILNRKLEADGYVIDPNIVEYLAMTIDTNVRELIGVLISVMARGAMSASIDMEMVKQVISNVVVDVDEELNIETITRIVSEYYKVPEDALKATTRKRDIVIPRQVAMYLAKDLTQSSLKLIGDFFGGKDHTTVMHAIKTVQEQLKLNEDLATAIAALQKRLQSI
jgi:chromosomal replication initiator protein